MGACGVAGTLLVDFDGVIRHWDPELLAALEAHHKLPAGSVSVAAFGEHSQLGRAVTGEITDQQWRDDVARKLAPLGGATAKAAAAEWSAMTGEIDGDAMLVLGRARRLGWRVGLLTNATTRLADDLRGHGLDEQFDEVVSSAQLGVAKPNPEVFLRACAQLGAAPQDCLFVDDTPANVEGAASVGLKAHLYEGTEWLAGMLGLSTR